MTKQDQAVQAQSELTDERIEQVLNRAGISKSEPYVYSAVRAIEREVRSAAREQARNEALKTIAEFPVTDPGNMDAWNMQAIAIGALKAEAPAAKAQPQWISVDERLPDDDCRVLAATWFTMTHDQHMDIVSFRRGSGQFSHSDVTHWMPLPEAPAASKEGDA